MGLRQPIELYPGQWAEHDKKMKVINMQTEILRIACADVIEAMSRAARFPAISRHEVETANAACARAYAAACQLDPKEEEEL